MQGGLGEIDDVRIYNRGLSGEELAALYELEKAKESKPDPLTYKIEGNSVTITDCDKSYEVDLVIPSSYQGKPVTKIGNNAFSSCRRTSRCRIRLETQVVGGTR